MVTEYEITYQGRTLRVPALKHQGRLWFHWQGQTHVVDIGGGGARRAGGGKASSAQPGVITAPMPGKITRVAVKMGDVALKGQALVVMEAMKMEYTLQADRDGKVNLLNAKVGEQVGLGDVLVKLEVGESK